MQFRPSRKLMYEQLVLALLFPVIPIAFIWGLLIVLGKGDPWSVPMVMPIAVSVLVGITLLRILYILLHFPTIRYEIDAQNVTNSEGLFWRVKRSTPVDKITNVDVRQGPLERMLGVGQVWVFTPSTGAVTPEAMLIGVEDPHGVRAQLLALAEDAKSAETHRATASTHDGAYVGDNELLAEMLATLRRIELLLKSGRGH